MTCELTIELSDETARAISQSINSAVVDGQMEWTFTGDFDIQDAVQIKEQLDAQL